MLHRWAASADGEAARHTATGIRTTNALCRLRFTWDLLVQSYTSPTGTSLRLRSSLSRSLALIWRIEGHARIVGIVVRVWADAGEQERLDPRGRLGVTPERRPRQQRRCGALPRSATSRGWRPRH